MQDFNPLIIVALVQPYVNNNAYVMYLLYTQGNHVSILLLTLW